MGEGPFVGDGARHQVLRRVKRHGGESSQSLSPLSQRLGRQRRQRTGIQPGTESDADRMNRPQAGAHRRTVMLQEALDVFLVGTQSHIGCVLRPPVGLHVQAQGGCAERPTRKQAVDAFPKGMGGVVGEDCEITGDLPFIQFAGDFRKGQEGMRTGSEGKKRRFVIVKQAGVAHLIPGEEHPAQALIPGGERPVAEKMPGGFLPPTADRPGGQVVRRGLWTGRTGEFQRRRTVLPGYRDGPRRPAWSANPPPAAA